MKNNNRYVDVYSHSNVTNNRTVKSRGSLKSILCFLLCIFILACMVGFYCLGTFVEQNKAMPFIDTSNKQSGNIKTETTDLNNALNSVVGVFVYNDNNNCYGSGVIVSQNGYIVTADHLFKNIHSAKIIVYDSNGEYYNGAFIGGDLKSDIAVIKIEKTGLQYSQLTNIDSNVGDKVYSISCPMNKSLAMSVTSGIISGKDRRFKTDNGTKSLKMLQTDAPINPGSSGGGLFNSSGDLIGLNCSKIVDESYEGVAFAVPSKILNDVVTNIIEFGKYKNRAGLGIKYDCIDYTTALKNGVYCGLVINSINVNSSLYGLGINTQDIIISINDKKIYDEDIFLDELEKLNVGDKVKLVINNKSFTQYQISANLIEEKSTSNYIG